VFSSAYHSGFNIGFNVAESVNFATLDWLSIFGNKIYNRKRPQKMQLLKKKCKHQFIGFSLISYQN